ncbi:MAG: hypothetical protein K6B40_05555 [Firmicutes bacterium]|nr:hypothetical protein [Bacillota bacterium]
MTCFFIGHRHVPAALRAKLGEAVERHITEYSVTEFVVGHYGQFDKMAAGVVRDARKRHRQVTLMLLLPYYPYHQVRIPEDYDATFYPEGMEFVPKSAAIVRANRYMVQSSSFLICYNAKRVGNTRDIVEFALRREKKGLIRVTNLAE